MLAHIHIMKTGGQTICDILRRSFPGSHCDLQAPRVECGAELQLARQLYPRMKSLTGHYVRPYGDLADLAGIRYFVFLRDPAQRCASHYQFLVQRNGYARPFEYWLRRGGSNQQARYLAPQGTAEAAIDALERRVEFVGLLEQFDESLVLWQRWAGEKALNIRYRARNVAADNRIKQALLSDPGTREMIDELNQEDQRLYRYVREVVFPRQQREWGSPTPHEVASLTSAHGPMTREGLLSAAKRNLLYKPLVRALWRGVKPRASAASALPSAIQSAGPFGDSRLDTAGSTVH